MSVSQRLGRLRHGPRRLVRGGRALRVTLWNVLLLVACLGIVVAALEAYLRVAWPFKRSSYTTEFAPGAGIRLEPHSEVRWTNRADFWTVSRANSLGFLDREPPSRERAATSCHVAVVGDSFVMAREVPIADKLQVRLEDMAADRFPDLDVTTAAYAYWGTGQVQQLGWWEAHIARRPPKLVVLVFVHNDFVENAYPPWNADQHGYDLNHPPFAHARRAEDGRIVLHAPDALWQPQARSASRLLAAWQRIPMALRPYSASWIRARVQTWRLSAPAFFLDRPGRRVSLSMDELEFTAFALDKWKERTAEVGASLVVLASHSLRKSSDESLLQELTRMTAARGIPMVDQTEYILRQNALPRDANWLRDGHWNAAGHQWAAEALLEWLATHSSVCRD